MPVTMLTGPTADDEPVTLARARRHLRLPDDFTDDDADILDWISAAREECEGHLRRSIARQQLRLSLDVFPGGDGAIKLPRPPLAEIQSVVYTSTAGVDTTLTGLAYYIDDGQAQPWLLPAHGTTWPSTLDGVANAVRVTYLAGWTPATCPRAIVSWILTRIGTLYENREADAEKAQVPLTFVPRLLDRWRVYQDEAL